MPYNHFNVPDPQREGACSRDIWRIYNMLPENTNFTLAFYDSATYYRYAALEKPRKPLAYIDFPKCGNPMDPLTVEDHTNEMKDAFRRFGYSGYRNVLLDWRRGFGNVAIVTVILDLPERSAEREADL